MSSATDQRLKVGVVGASFAHSPDGRERWAVRAHIPALLHLKDYFTVSATCTTNRESARESAEAFGIDHSFDSVDKMLDDGDPDVVCVCVRPSRHYEVAKAALEAGKHVYCEHPMGVSSGEAASLVKLAKRSGVKTIVGHQTHHLPAVLQTKHMVSAGYIGEPLVFNYTYFSGNYITPRPSHRQWLFDADTGGHPGYRSGFSLDRVRSVLGEEIESVSADLSIKVPERPATDRAEPIKSDQVDNMHYLLRLTGGVSGTMQVGWTAWMGTEERLEIYGTEGMLMLRTDPSRGGWGSSISRRRSDPHSGHMRLFGGHVDVNSLIDRPAPPERLNGSYQEIRIDERWNRCPELDPEDPAFGVAQAWLALHDAIQGDGSCEPSFEDGLALHQVLDATEESARTRSWTPVVDPAGSHDSSDVGIQTE